MSDLVVNALLPMAAPKKHVSAVRRNFSLRPRVYELAKRVVDVGLSSTALLALAPVLAAAAIAVRLDSPGPVLFSQSRVGEGGRTFRCWKFRSMRPDAEQRKSELMARNEITDGPTFKIGNDPRITRIGRFLRKSSIDELPQLWNVLSGDMSLVGPRPAVPSEVAQYTPEQRGRLAVKPGITCLWQVSGRSSLPFTRVSAPFSHFLGRFEAFFTLHEHRDRPPTYMGH